MMKKGTYRFHSEHSDGEHTGHLINHEDDEVPLRDAGEDQQDREEHLWCQDKSTKLITKLLLVHGEEAQVDPTGKDVEQKDLYPWGVALLGDMCHLNANGDVGIKECEEQAWQQWISVDDLGKAVA